MGEMSVRFLVNKVSERILYMEASKDVVDLLLDFLQLPVATIMRIFTEKAGRSALKVGSISSIYESLQKMNEASLVVSKESILKTPSSNLRLCNKSKQILRLDQPATPANYSPFGSAAPAPFGSSSSLFARVHDVTPPPFGSSSRLFTTQEATPTGYVKDHLSFIVTDDLCILPASTIESIALLNKLNVETMSDLDSLECSITPDEALELLKVSFTSTNTLNHVFGHKVASSSFGTKSTLRNKSPV